ncbi:MAG: hypothetical protein HPY66_3367 [Firmicutes bacterium]|nr:hypothetical protein [Bacillota bacterium]
MAFFISAYIVYRIGVPCQGYTVVEARKIYISGKEGRDSSIYLAKIQGGI